MAPQPVKVDGATLTPADVVAVARDNALVVLTDTARAGMADHRRLVEQFLASGEAAYGVTTGVGVRKRFRIPEHDQSGYNQRMLADHRVGQCLSAPRGVIRAAALRLVNALACGGVSVLPLVAERLVAALNADQLPAIRVRGSLGLGDIGPLADLASGVFADKPLDA
jgi:histidine ammonia-lyase